MNCPLLAQDQNVNTDHQKLKVLHVIENLVDIKYLATPHFLDNFLKIIFNVLRAFSYDTLANKIVIHNHLPNIFDYVEVVLLTETPKR